MKEGRALVYNSMEGKEVVLESGVDKGSELDHYEFL